MNKQIEALKLALEALKDLLDQTEPPPDKNCSCHIAPPCSDCVDYSGVRYVIEQANKAITAIKEALAQPEQEPVALPPVQFEKVAEGIEVGYDFLGGVDIRLGGEFVYVHINYDYRYTHNAARKALAEQIVGLLTTPPQRTCEGCGKVAKP